MNKDKVYYIHENTSTAIRFTAAIYIDEEAHKVSAAFAYVHPKDNFKKVTGRGRAVSRLLRKPAVEFIIAEHEEASDIFTTVRNIGLLHSKEQREKIQELLKSNIYVH